MRVPRRRRGERVDGFTLVETIVTIGLIAVIAAFVIPTVVQQAGSGTLFSSRIARPPRVDSLAARTRQR